MARPAEPCELTASIVVNKPIQQCWDLYIDNTRLPQWAPAITDVACENTHLTLNTSRTANVVIDGKHGHTVEQCTLMDPLKRIEMNVTQESFGFSHMLTNYGVVVTFDVDNEQTLLVLQTRYTPKKIFASIMNAKSTQQPIQVLMNDTLASFKRYAELT